MTDTLWADISEFQYPVNSNYPHKVICIRSNDDYHRDNHFIQNREWCDKAVTSGHLAGYLIYYFWRPGGGAAATHQAMVGRPGPRTVTMIDVEAGSGARGDHSAELNAEHARLVAWHGGNPRRIIGYGNIYDLAALWPHRPAGMRLVIANYSYNPAYPGKLAHQWTDHGTCAPFGTCDMNSADGYTLQAVSAALGW